MPRKTSDDWQSDDRGRYRRMVGWCKDEHGRKKQYPFHFGTSKDQACARFMRVKELWSWIEEHSKRPPVLYVDGGSLPDAQTEAKEPLWGPETLWIARELAAGRVQICLLYTSEAETVRAHT